MIDNKEAFRKAIQDDIAKEVAAVVHTEFPKAATVHYNPNVEYYDQDYEYFASTLSIYGEDDKPIIDLNNLEDDNDEDRDYDKIRHLTEKIEMIIDRRDFSFAYDTDGGAIDIAPYMK